MVTTALLFGCLFTRAPHASEPVPPPVVNGTATSDHEAVGALLYCTAQGCGSFCSGTLVNASWVITAAHCADAMQTDYAAYDLYFVVGSDLTTQSGYQDYSTIGQVHIHPNYSEIDLTADIGLVNLQWPISSVEPMVVNDDSITRSWVDEDIRFVGFGTTSDAGYGSGVKRYADIPLYDYSAEWVYAWDQTGTQNVCYGDSGGAALEILGNDRYELLGVNSFVWSPNGDNTPCEGGANGSVRVDYYRSWVEQYTSLTYEHDTSDDDDDTPVSGDTGFDTGNSAPDDGNDGRNRGLDDDEDAWWADCSSLPAPQGLYLLTLLGGIALWARRR